MANTKVEELTITIKVDNHDAVTKINEVASAIRQLSKDAGGTDIGKLSSIASNLKELSKAAEKLNAVSKNFNNIFQNFGNANSARQISNTTDALTRFHSAANSAASSSNNVSRASKGLFRVGDLAKSIGGTFSTAYKYGMRLAKIPFSMMFTPLKGVAGIVKSIGSSFTGLLSRIGRVAFTRAIRAAIRAVTQAVREGVNNLYLWASAVGNTFKPTMDSLATSFLYLKNSVGAAVSPILDALAPAIDVAIEKFVDMLNTFNQVVSTMIGATSWRKAVKSAASYADNISGLGHEAQGANDAVKELKRTLLGFDEINRLDDATKTTSPASKGKDATGYYAKQGALSFVEMPLSQPVKTFVSRLKDAWENADFTGIGNTIGEKIGGALLNVPWATKIQPTTKRLASSFGTLLNGMFGYSNSGGKAMWDGIAYTVYNSLNTALLGYVTFFTTVDWRDIGRGLGEALKRSLYGIDWGLVREALAAFPNAVIKALNGFNEQFTINDFYEIGHKIGDAVAGAITDIEWVDMFKGATGLARRILSGINGALEGFGEHWGDIKDGITEGIKSVPQKTWDSLGEDIGNVLFNIAYFGANLLDTAMKAIESIHWGRLIGSIWKGIDEKVTKVYGGWGGAAIALGKWIVGNLGVLSLLLTFSIGKLLIAALTSSIAKYMIGSALATAAPQIFSIAGTALSAALTIGLVFTITSVLAKPMADLKDKFMNSLPDWLKKLTGWDSDRPKKTGMIADNLQGATLSAPNGTESLVDPVGAAARKVKRKFGGNSGSKSSLLAVKIPVEVALDNVKQQFSNLQTKWKQETSGKPAGDFKIDLLPEPDKWRKQRDTSWESGVLTIPALPFQTAGVKDESPLWKQQAYMAWRTQVKASFAEKFRTGGIVDEGDKWWNSAKRFWKTAIKGESLKATVTVGGSGGSLWNVFVGAWNKLQGYFNNNPLTAWIQKVTSPRKADGGVFQNGRWHDITRYAAGGMPSSGEMFIAREAGPEMVGTLNGSTAVVNNEQIVASIADGVYRATLAAMGSQGQNPMNDITVKIDSEVIYRAARRGEKIANNRYGTVVTVGG